MATIQLTDQFGLDITLDPDPVSVFTKYVKGLMKTDLTLKDAKNITGDTVGTYPFSSQSLGLSFQQGIPLGTSSTELTIEPNVSGSIVIGGGDELLDTTLYDKPEAKPLLDQKYLSAALEASLTADVAATSGDLQFGFDAGAGVVLTYSQPVNPTDELISAIKTTLTSFTIPGDLEDLRGMAERSVASVQGSGTLTFTGTLNVATVSNPLATVASGMPVVGSISLNEGGSIEVSASICFTGSYQLQVTKLDPNRILLAYSRGHGQELDVSFTSEIGVSAALGSYDLIKILLQTVSPDAVPPVDDLKKAGLGEDEIDAISKAIKAGLERHLEISLKAELDLSDQHTAAFLYEIDLAALDEAGKLAVHKGIDGDLSGLEQGNLKGVKALRSVIVAARETTRKLKLNLLGILNVGSISDLLRESTLICDPDTGDMTIIDKTTASDVGYTINNLAKDGTKLRRIVADGFLATCVYRASQTGFRANVASKCWAFALYQSTNFDQIQDDMNIAVTLGLITPNDAGKKLADLKNIRQFGRSIFCAESSYDDVLFRTLFFDASGQLRPQDYYEAKGRGAMAATLAPGDSVNQARLLPLTNHQVWQSMSGGATTFPNLFGGYLSGYGLGDAALRVIISDITGDYNIIMWWASAMTGLGQALSSLLEFLNNSGVKDPHNNTFIALKGDLDNKLSAVAQQTHDRFAEPWGFVAMDMASEQQSPTDFLFTSPRLSLSLSRGRQTSLASAAVGRR